MNMDFNDRLIMATYQNDYPLVKELIEMDEFDERIVHDIELLYHPFPLYYITMCNRKVLDSGFRDDLMPMVNAHKKNADLLLDLWKTRFGVDTDSEIDYHRYKIHFFSDADNCPAEEILMDPVQKYLDGGCRQIDIDLYVAVSKFKFKKVKKLLDKGANPDADLLPVGEQNTDNAKICFKRIGRECSFLGTCEVIPQMFGEEDPCCYDRVIDERKIGCLVGWAAHEEMCNLLEKAMN